MTYSQEELNNIVDVLILDNNLNLVTPAKVRQAMKAVISSLDQTNAGSVSASPPLDYDGFTNIFSILKADADNDGYLSKEDWELFNSAVGLETPDATTTIKGKLKLAGDLGGTADAPTVPALANKADLVSGKVPSSQLPSYVDDILEGYLFGGVFYNEVGHTTVIPAETGKIYIDLTTGQKNKEYRYSGSAYIQITNGLIASTDDVPESATNLYYTASRSAAKQDNLVSGTNIKTINGTTVLGSGNITTPDMDTTTAQNVSGVKTFFAGMFGLRNTANTFTSFFASAVTASRTWTLQDRNGTLLDNTDLSTINTALGTKQSVFSGVANYLTKSITSTTLGVSRLFDNGTFFGIGTVNAPTKDITMGRGNKEIGVENSDNSSKGGDLIVSAASTANTSSALLEPLLQALKQWFHMSTAPNGDIYATEYNGGKIWKRAGGVGNFIDTGNNGGLGITVDISGNVYICRNNQDIYKQTGGVGALVALGQTYRGWWGMGSSLVNNNVYSCVAGGDIYMQTAGIGNFNPLGQTSRAWQGVTGHPNSNMYAIVNGGDIYMQTAGIGNFNPLGQTSRAWSAIYCSPSGNVYATVVNGDVYMQTNGIGNFVATGQVSRNYGGICVDASNNIYAGVGHNSAAGDIYYIATGTGPANLDGGALIQKAGLAKGTGKSRIEGYTGQKTASGTNMQLMTKRYVWDEDGNYARIGTPVYADNTAALAGGLTAGMEYRTATGIKMEVY